MFKCDEPFCDKEAKINGKCVSHACEAAKKRYIEPPVIPHEPHLEKGEEKKEKEMSEERCSECKRTAEEHGTRLYGGKCKDCRSKGKTPRKERGKKEPRERMGGGKKVGGVLLLPRAKDDKTVATIRARFDESLAQARVCREALIVIKNLTAAEIEIPEIEA